MDRLTGMEIFARVAQTASFSEAAKQMGLSKSAVSKHVTELETRLGVRLINRTTRSLALTEVGQAYYERCQRLLDDLFETELAIRALHSEARGLLKVTAPITFTTLHVAPALPGFLAKHPHLRIDLSLSDRYVDLIDEGFDLAIRIGEMKDSSLVARKLGATRRLVCGAPGYFAKHGRPEIPANLRAFDCLLYTNRPPVWEFQGPEGPISVPVAGTLQANSGEALRVAALNGAGLVVLPSFFVGKDIAEGRLESVLEEYCPPEAPIHAVYPHNRHLSAKVRAFVDFLAEVCAEIPS